MEIDSLVDYSNVTSFDGFRLCCSNKGAWDAGVAIPDVTMAEEHVLPCYTLDDVTSYNRELGHRDWFKYGQRVYSKEKIQAALRARRKENVNSNDTGESDDSNENDDSDDIDDYDNKDDFDDTENQAFCGVDLDGAQPIYALRKSGIVKADLKAVLDQSIVGNLIPVDKYTQLVQFKSWVEDVLKGMKNVKNVSKISKNVADYKDQLERWLNDFPCVENDRYKHPANCVDHNDNFFPLPALIMCNPLVLREWSEEWPIFDCEVPEEGAWEVTELLNEEIGDTHEVFVELVHSHVDDAIAGFETEITGISAWTLIEEGCVELDKTTEGQDRIWEARERRTNYGDRGWMRKRRKEIGERLATRHGWSSEKLEPYLAFCDNIERDWDTFQKLC